jgi:hypothetical protein
MKSSKSPIFILSSGRSGSSLIQKIFKDFDYVDSNHELNLMSYKPEIVEHLYFNTEQSLTKLNKKLKEHYYKRINLSRSRVWLDSNYSLAPIIQLLLNEYPEAKVVNLVRNGLKVVSSWYNKLGNEIYGDKEMAMLHQYLNNKNIKDMPERIKKNWWYVFSKNSEKKLDFLKLSQFEKICYHWVKSYNWAKKVEKEISSDNYFELKLEDMVSDKKVLRNLFLFMEISFKDKYVSHVLKPYNVHTPVNYTLSRIQKKKYFNKICGDLMDYLNYSLNSEYMVKY